MFSRGFLLVGYLLLMLLSISALQNGVLGARILSEKKLEEDQQKKPQQTWKENPDSGSDDGFVATINREVPSCPDPLHNR